MKRLSGSDAFTLAMETPRADMHTLTIAIIDPHYHSRSVACPQPADHRALCEFVSSSYACQLYRDRPLWILCPNPREAVCLAQICSNYIN